MQEMPRILIISMVSSTDRRALQISQARHLDLAFDFMDATPVGDISPEDMGHLQRRWARRLRDTEVACALSHRKAWEIVAKGWKPVLILEDDAILSSETPAILAALAALPDIDCVNLETFGQRKTLGRAAPLDLTNHTLAPIFRDSAGAAAYVLWPQGARKLLGSLNMMLPLADAAINLTLSLRKMQLEPACAIQVSILHKSVPISHTVRKSLIASSKKLTARPPIAEWLGYKLRRVWISAILALQIVRGLGRSSRRTVEYADKANAHSALKQAFPELANPPA